jgi:FkbM family methyltransferase
MELLRKIFRKLHIEYKFYSVQKFGLFKPDVYTIPKYKLTKLLPGNSVIIDCGAHVGSDSVELSRIFPNAAIHSFEAVPSIYERLVHNTRKRKNIACHHLALSNKTGDTIMHVSSGSDDGSSSLLPPKEHLEMHPGIVFNEKIVVKAMSLDDWAAEEGIDRVDFLWLDMQGFEFPMLEASTKIFKTVKAIHTEVNTTDSYENVVKYTTLKQWLEANGFVEYLKALPQGCSQGNVLFIRK